MEQLDCSFIMALTSICLLWDSAQEFSTVAADGSKSHEDNTSDSNFLNAITEKADDVASDQVLTLAIPEKSLLQTGSSKLSSNREVVSSGPTGDHGISNAKDLHEVMMNGEVKSPKSRGIANKLGGRDSTNNGNKSFAFGPRGHDNGSLAVKYPCFFLLIERFVEHLLCFCQN